LNAAVAPNGCQDPGRRPQPRGDPYVGNLHCRRRLETPWVNAGEEMVLNHHLLKLDPKESASLLGHEVIDYDLGCKLFITGTEVHVPVKTVRVIFHYWKDTALNDRHMNFVHVYKNSVESEIVLAKSESKALGKIMGKIWSIPDASARWILTGGDLRDISVLMNHRSKAIDDVLEGLLGVNNTLGFLVYYISIMSRGYTNVRTQTVLTFMDLFLRCGYDDQCDLVRWFVSASGCTEEDGSQGCEGCLLARMNDIAVRKELRLAKDVRPKCISQMPAHILSVVKREIYGHGSDVEQYIGFTDHGDFTTWVEQESDHILNVYVINKLNPTCWADKLRNVEMSDLSWFVFSFLYCQYIRAARNRFHGEVYDQKYFRYVLVLKEQLGKKIIKRIYKEMSRGLSHVADHLVYWFMEDYMLGSLFDGIEFPSIYSDMFMRMSYTKLPKSSFQHLNEVLDEA
jgi:hypothetical protein